MVSSVGSDASIQQLGGKNPGMRNCLFILGVVVILFAAFWIVRQGPFQGFQSGRTLSLKQMVQEALEKPHIHDTADTKRMVQSMLQQVMAKLQASGAKLYVSYTCPHCHDLLLDIVAGPLRGDRVKLTQADVKEAIGILSKASKGVVVDCSSDPLACQKAGISGVPAVISWDGMAKVGTKTADDVMAALGDDPRVERMGLGQGDVSLGDLQKELDRENSGLGGARPQTIYKPL